jgi:hypothetical protein
LKILVRSDKTQLTKPSSLPESGMGWFIGQYYNNPCLRQPQCTLSFTSSCNFLHEL